MAQLAYKWKVMITVVFGVWMIVLDSTVVNVAFPTVRRAFGAGIDSAQWVISVYVLALGIATPLAGFISDKFGLKNVYIGGLSVFLLGSLLSGVAPNLGSLIGARALQGVRGGIAQPLSVAMLFMSFPPREQGRAFGIFGVVMIVAPALGPILGGLLADWNLWRWIFFINIPIGLMGIILAAKLLQPAEQKQSAHLNPVSIVTVVIGFACVLYATSIANHYGWTSTQVLGFFGVGVAALCIFAVIDLKFVRDPLLDLRLFRERTFLTANVVGYVAVIALFGAEFLLPVYLQSLRGRTALQSGLILLPLAVTAGLVNPFAGRLSDKIGPRLLVIIGSIVLLVNSWQFAQLTADTAVSRILVLVGLRGIAISLIMQATYTTALGAVPRNAVPRGSSLVNSTRFLAQALGIAMLATVLGSALSPQSRQFQQQKRNDDGSD
jgi:EmrB/QacA subfamily drug resistance transporter